MPTLHPAPVVGALLLLAAGVAAAQTNGAPPEGGTGTLIGWVTDRAACTPVAGARVALGAAGAVLTDGSGRFAIGAVRPDTYTVRAARAGYADTMVAGVQIAAGPPTDLLVALAPARSGTGAPGGTAPGQATGGEADPAPAVSWSPVIPRQGTLFRVRVRDTVDAGWKGEVAGEALHFTRDRAEGFSALAAVPIDAPDSVVLRVRGSGVSVTRSVPVGRGAYRVERLQVAPRFGTRPDSALAERLAYESMQARGVACRAHHTPRLWKEPFVRPRPGRVTSGFGGSREFNGVVQSRHMGTDLAGAVGAPIRATNRGVVALVGDFFLGGRVVYLDHGAGLVSAYLHLSKVEVSEGDTVPAGGLVGRVGATGRVTGPHLHWIVRYGSVTVDPMSLFTAGVRREQPAASKRAPRPAADSARDSVPPRR